MNTTFQPLRLRSRKHEWRYSHPLLNRPRSPSRPLPSHPLPSHPLPSQPLPSQPLPSRGRVPSRRKCEIPYQLRRNRRSKCHRPTILLIARQSSMDSVNEVSASRQILLVEKSSAGIERAVGGNTSASTRYQVANHPHVSTYPWRVYAPTTPALTESRTRIANGRAPRSAVCFLPSPQPTLDTWVRRNGAGSLE